MKLREVEETAFECLNNVIYRRDVTSLAGADAQVQAGIGLAILALAKAIDRLAQAKEREFGSKERELRSKEPPGPGGDKGWNS